MEVHFETDGADGISEDRNDDENLWCCISFQGQQVELAGYYRVVDHSRCSALDTIQREKLKYRGASERGNNSTVQCTKL
ncbi:hypothetical protein EVAR_72784_1 [Eumeta japonica]|uniref:Uncharacterized protein n=1 Tax=Eumeta variegata TaxID=151549 RepID=A0A4C1TRH9_EUMVA|nr:hypothetical protein EVAR_72784_1 [Eumeta japonica]